MEKNGSSVNLSAPQPEQELLLPQVSGLRDLWRQLRTNSLALWGLGLLSIFFFIAAAGLILTEGRQPIMDPEKVRLVDTLKPPLTKANESVLAPEDRPLFGIYLLGTDKLGRDVLARMLQGAHVSLLVGFISVGISVVLGIVLGALAGYSGYYVDSIIMRVVDIMLCFPSFFLILTVVALLPPSIWNIMIVIGLTSWPPIARFVRAEFLALKKQDFVVAAEALGLSKLKIMFVHMVPNAIAPVLVTATIEVASAILTESSLSFLGFGVPPPAASWGNILSDGKEFIFDAPWLFIASGTAILLTVLAFNLFGEGLREALNPRLRER
ncbi:MAG: ABC transporter permease [bacterium]|nr:ABC transporter permease [bacterium]